MTNDYRAMCSELVELSAPVDSVPQLAERLQKLSALADRARALLAQPVDEGPTDEEIADWHDQCADLTHLGEADHHWAFDLRSDEVAGVVRAALTRWGRPTPQPVAVSERLPGAEDCDKLETCWQWEPDINGHHPLGLWERVHRDWVSDPDSDTTHWLPAYALPTPEATNG